MSESDGQGAGHHPGWFWDEEDILLAAPVMLSPPPTSEDPTERPTLERYQRLCRPVGATPAPADLRGYIGELRRVFPWLDGAPRSGAPIRAVAADLAIDAQRWEVRGNTGSPPFHLRPTLLVGPPGTGKTRLARTLAATAGVPFRSVTVADVTGISVVVGNARGWRGAKPGLAIEVILSSGVRNPLILLDEIEKAPRSDQHGSVVDALLPLLEPESARRYEDQFLGAPCDLSAVSWVLACNDATSLPDALLSRVRVVHVSPPPPSAFEGLLNSIMLEVGGPGMSLPDGLAGALARRFGNEDLSIRDLRVACEAAVGEVALAAVGLYGDASPEVAAETALAARHDACGRSSYSGQGKVGFRDASAARWP